MSDLEQRLSKLHPKIKNAPEAAIRPHNQEIQTKQASAHKKKVNSVNEAYKRKQDQYKRLGSMRADFLKEIDKGADAETLLMLAIDMLEITTDKAFTTTAKNKLKGKLK